MKTGLLGGSFDPIHNAHLALADAACRHCGLDRVFFIPSGTSYHKGRDLSSDEDRTALVLLAIENDPRFLFSDVDIRREGNTYTADTLKILKQQYPADEFYFIVGEDSLFQMENWSRPEEIFKGVVIAAASRPGKYRESMEKKAQELTERFQARIVLLPMPESGISSSAIRQAAADREDLSAFLPDKEIKYIQEHGMYREAALPADPDQIKSDLTKILKPSRYRHTIGVAETAAAMAEAFGLDKDRAYLAGLLHDCAKNHTDSDMLHLSLMAGLPVTEAERRAPYLLHGKLGAYYAQEKYHITDEDILNAVRFHTTGRPAMSDLEKIIFVADYIEPGRKEAPHLEHLRKIAYKDLDRTVWEISRDTLEYLEKAGKQVDDSTAKTCEYYRLLQQI